jgi:hypothetical protein
MHVSDDLFATATLTITPWADPVIDGLGHDPRSAYVEQFWLGILGPSTTWLLRRLAAGLDHEPDGFDLPLADTARALGLGTRGGRHSPFLRAVGRACQFGLAHPVGSTGMAVRRHVPPLTRHQVSRLPAATQRAHESWQADDLRAATGEHHRRRARRLALSLVELGEDPDATERQLHGWQFHPALASEATRWAWQRHLSAAAAALPGDDAA